MPEACFVPSEMQIHSAPRTKWRELKNRRLQYWGTDDIPISLFLQQPPYCHSHNSTLTTSRRLLGASMVDTDLVPFDGSYHHHLFTTALPPPPPPSVFCTKQSAFCGLQCIGYPVIPSPNEGEWPFATRLVVIQLALHFFMSRCTAGC
jgi:hypothetical protein